MSPILERLRQGPVLVLDGGLGTMLLARGLARGAPPERWVLERPQEVEAVHRAYVEAGSEAVHTDTFGGNTLRLAAFGLAERTEEINSSAVEIARRSGAPFVIGDLGPTGEYLPPMGKGDPAAFQAAYRGQAAALVGAGADALHAETQSDLREAQIALAAMREVAGAVPCCVSLTVERKRRGFFTVMGDPLAASLAALAAAGADAVGVNCTLGSSDMLALAEEARAASSVPLLLQPNAGQPEIGPGGKLSYRQEPDAFAVDGLAMVTAGAAAIGGCCGTDPRFVAAFARRLGKSAA